MCAYLLPRLPNFNVSIHSGRFWIGPYSSAWGGHVFMNPLSKGLLSSRCISSVRRRNTLIDYFLYTKSVTAIYPIFNKSVHVILSGFSHHYFLASKKYDFYNQWFTELIHVIHIDFMCLFFQAQRYAFSIYLNPTLNWKSTIVKMVKWVNKPFWRPTIDLLVMLWYDSSAKWLQLNIGYALAYVKAVSCYWQSYFPIKYN